MEDGAGEQTRSLLAYGKPIPVYNESRERAADEDPEVQDVLNSILPPRQYTNDKRQMYVECVLSTPATAKDVTALHVELAARLVQRRTREVGICPVREDLFAQCFDELIRQITVHCVHRGLLLVRIRDEFRMLIDAHQQLQESALAYGLRKALLTKERKSVLETELQAEQRAVAELEDDVAKLERELSRLEEEERTLGERERAGHEEHLATARLKNQHMKAEIERLLVQAP